MILGNRKGKDDEEMCADLKKDDLSDDDEVRVNRAVATGSEEKLSLIIMEVAFKVMFRVVILSRYEKVLKCDFYIL